jgi:hypothetical protein
MGRSKYTFLKVMHPVCKLIVMQFIFYCLTSINCAYFCSKITSCFSLMKTLSDGSTMCHNETTKAAKESICRNLIYQIKS